jgi:hypothetical protein
MRRGVTIAAVLAGLAVAGLAFAFLQGYEEIWIGFYDLTVRVESPNDRPRVVRCYVFSSWDSADRVCREMPEAKFAQSDRAVGDPFDAGPLVVLVKMTGARSFFGRDRRRVHERGLLVQAEWADGRRACRAVYIPDEWETHEVRVILP